MFSSSQTLVHLPFFNTAAHLPNKLALVCDGKRHTYKELSARVEQLAELLSDGGIQRGDRVALFLDNSVELVVGLIAISSIGGVFMPVNGLTRTEKLAYLLNDARASALITHAVLRPVWLGRLSINKTVRDTNLFVV